MLQNMMLVLELCIMTSLACRISDMGGSAKSEIDPFGISDCSDVSEMILSSTSDDEKRTFS